MFNNTIFIIVIIITILYYKHKFLLTYPSFELSMININIIIYIIIIINLPIQISYRLFFIIIIIYAYRKLICISSGILTIYATYKLNPEKSKNNKQLTKQVTNIINSNFNFKNNFKNLPSSPTIFVANYTRDRYEYLSCMLIPRKLKVLMSSKQSWIFNNIFDVIERDDDKKDGQFNNITQKTQETMKEGKSVFVYITKPVHVENQFLTGRIRKGMFAIAKKLGVTITPIAIDYIHHNNGIIPYQNYEMLVGEPFYVQDPLQDSIRTRHFFNDSLKKFKKNKFLFKRTSIRTSTTI